MDGLKLEPIFPRKEYKSWETKPVNISEYNCFAGNKNNYKLNQIVKVYDGSYNFDKRTGEHRHGIDPLFNNPAVNNRN
jgi:hypothetical protein